MKVDRCAFSSGSSARELTLYRATCSKVAFCLSGDDTSRRGFFSVERLKVDPGDDHFFVMLDLTGLDRGFPVISYVSACKQITAAKQVTNSTGSQFAFHSTYDSNDRLLCDAQFVAYRRIRLPAGK